VAVVQQEMAFNQLSTSVTGRRIGDRNQENTAPDIWGVFRALRNARSIFGLKPGHIQTLQALLSFLRPGHGDTVFASNVEICRRIGGIDERTLRRHVDKFIELGFITRHDSPNRKRYRVRSCDGQSLSFGLSLSPLMERANELIAAAINLENEHRDQIFLRKQILVKLSAIDGIETDNELATNSRKLLRRKLVTAEYRDLLAKIDVELQQMSTTVDVAVPTKMPASDGQIVRHHSMSKKIRKDSEEAQNTKLPDVQTLAAVCTEAAAFATSPLRTWEDVGKHAQMLAPMMGITPATFAEARRNIGSEKTASAVFLLLQLGQRVRNHAAYFHSITIGRKTADFHPWHLLERLSRSADLAT